LARDSELGPGHRIVIDGKAHIMRLRKLHIIDRENAVVSQHISDLEAAKTRAQTEPNGLCNLADTIRVSASIIGAAHPAVDDAVQFYQRSRNNQLFCEWDELVSLHTDRLKQATSTNEPETIQAGIDCAIRSGLGRGHPIVLESKDYLLNLKKDMQRTQIETYKKTSAETLRELTLNARQCLYDLEEKVSRADDLKIPLEPCLQKPAL